MSLPWRHQSITWIQELSLLGFTKVQIQMLQTQQSTALAELLLQISYAVTEETRRVAHKKGCSFSPAEGFKQGGSYRKHQGISPLGVPQAGDGIFT